MPRNILPGFSRRDLLVKGSKLSVASLGLLAGLNTKAVAEENEVRSALHDIDALNTILAMEFTGIAAYQLCTQADLFKRGTIQMALIFQDHHQKHRDILIEKITTLGGKPAAPKKQEDYARDLHINELKNQKDTFTMLVKWEFDAANAYIDMLPTTNDRELAQTAARIAADEVIHWTSINALLRDPLPSLPLSFGRE